MIAPSGSARVSPATGVIDGRKGFVVPILGHASFEQTVFEREIGDDFFQRLGFETKLFDLARGGRTRGVTGQAAFAGFEEFFRPAVILR